MTDTMVYALVLAGYMVLVVGIGVLASRRKRSREELLLGGRRIGAWVTSLSYVAAYFSSVVIIGGGAFGYRYGLATLWIGGINVLIGITLAWMVLGRRLRVFTARLGTMTVPGFLARIIDVPHDSTGLPVQIPAFVAPQGFENFFPGFSLLWYLKHDASLT